MGLPACQPKAQYTGRAAAFDSARQAGLQPLAGCASEVHNLGTMAIRTPMLRFGSESLTALDRNPYIYIKAGSKPHRAIVIWVIVVERRIFVRSWGYKPRSWNRVLEQDPTAVIQVGKKKLKVRAIRTRSDRLKRLIDRAYLKKYARGGMMRFAKDMGRSKSRATTIELVPLSDDWRSQLTSRPAISAASGAKASRQRAAAES